jgi:peptide/nickel transport system permease protein
MAIPAGKLAAEVTLADRVHHLVLPVLTLTVVSIGKIALFTRQKAIEILSGNYILFARARGENRAQLAFRHLLRNTALPAVTLQFASFSELFGGMTLAETVFSYPGIGTATTAAALNGDAPLLLGIALIGALFVFSGNLVANILYGVVDPRLSEGGDYV